MMKMKHLPMIVHIFQLALAMLLAGVFMLVWVGVGAAIYTAGAAVRFVFLGG